MVLMASICISGSCRSVKCDIKAQSPFHDAIQLIFPESEKNEKYSDCLLVEVFIVYEMRFNENNKSTHRHTHAHAHTHTHRFCFAGMFC